MGIDVMGIFRGRSAGNALYGKLRDQSGAESYIAGGVLILAFDY